MDNTIEYRFPRDTAPQPWPFEYKVEQFQSKPEIWHATTPYRQIVWAGETREEAIGMMLRGFAELARGGSLDPANPHRIGETDMQHAMACLTTALARHVERRREQIEFQNERQGKPDKPQAYDQLDPQSFNRLNEIISGLATSIAALARVKEL